MPSADLEIIKAAIDDLSIYSFILSILRSGRASCRERVLIQV